MIKKILIIGGNGFLGHNLALALVNLNYDLTLLCKKRKTTVKIKNAKYLFCDISKEKELKSKLKTSYDCIINFSGNINHKNKKETYDIHFFALRKLFRILKKSEVKLFIQAGSSLEYGKNSSPQKEKIKCKPLSDYARAKYSTSKILMKQNNFKYIILRLYQVFGPFQKEDRLIPITITSCLKDKKFKCTDGKQKRDFLYVNDFVNLIVKILRRKKHISGIFNVGSGRPVRVRFIIEKIHKIIKSGEPIFGGLKMRKEEILSLYPNTNKVKKTFNWKPKVDILDGINKTVKFYKKKYNLGV